MNAELKNKIAREIAIDRQIRMLPESAHATARKVIEQLWDKGTSKTDNSQRENYLRDVDVVCRMLEQEKA